LVVAGVLLNEEDAAYLKRIGVQDSKQLSDAEIKRLAAQIRERCGDKVAVLALSPAVYNRKYEEFSGRRLNLNALLAWGHATVIEELLGRHSCMNVLSDQFADERLLLGQLQERGRSVHLVQEPRAERHIAVAAASVIAREGFVTGLDELSKKYQCRLPKGAGPQVISAGKRFVAEKGKAELRDVAKLHFKTTERIGGGRGR
jgi:ribonuclease HIII